MDGAPLAGALAGLRAELPTRKQGKKQLFHAELVRTAAAIVTREGVTGLLSFWGPTIIGAESRVKPCGPDVPRADGQRPTIFGARPLVSASPA